MIPLVTIHYTDTTRFFSFSFLVLSGLGILMSLAITGRGVVLVVIVLRGRGGKRTVQREVGCDASKDSSVVVVA